MTLEQFITLKWEFRSHMSAADEHTSVRIAKAYGHAFGICNHVPTDEYRLEHPHTKATTHYMVDGNVYKSIKTLGRAIKDIKI